MAKAASLYVHIPFCESKCAYCDFASFSPKDSSGKEHLVRPYVDALKREVEISPALPLKTVFFGGGTPSLLEAEMIAEIMEAIGKRFAIEKNAEVTIEANPATVSLEKLKAIKDAGINRLSIGVQSFNDDSLKSLGRIHTAADALNTISYAKRAGFDNISL
ncbi:MAG: radical SAM protein, partial [Nitrospinota bacterium]